MLCKQYPSPVFVRFAAALKRSWKVFSISQFAELTSLMAAFDPDWDCRKQLCEKA